MHNLLKRHYASKPGCGCALCKPHKHNGADHRTRQDIRADISTLQQLQELDVKITVDRSVESCTVTPCLTK